MGDLFNLDVNSVENVNPYKEISDEERLNGYIDRFSKLIRKYLTDPSIYNELLLVFKAIKGLGYDILDSNRLTFSIKLDNGWYIVARDIPTSSWDDPNFEYHVRLALVLNYIRFPDMLELDSLIEAYRNKCEDDNFDSDPFYDTATESC